MSSAAILIYGVWDFMEGTQGVAGWPAIISAGNLALLSVIIISLGVLAHIALDILHQLKLNKIPSKTIT